VPNYRRVFVDGGCWFFTVNLEDRSGRLLTERIGALREAVAKVRRSLPFDINAWVVLPDHVHAIWTLPPDDSDFSTRWRLIKTFLSKSLPAGEWRSAVHKARNERAIWQRRYWEHLIRDEKDYLRHVHYCYFNPVKHGLVANVEDWPYSSFHRDMKTGFNPTDWESIDGAFGERDGKRRGAGRRGRP
jgi:putative transposase